jgi:molybdenum-dependent DNA-binding transcriptional regulator ModE
MTSNRLHNLDLGTLRSFVTIADSGSMTRAASRLFMTQSAISMQIKRLESTLGFSVFDRSSQGMKPTAEGEQLLQYANRMLAINDEAMGRLTQVLKEQFELGQQDVILTTERQADKGGRVLNTQPLLWTGAEDGVAWKKRPLPICFSRNCAFRPVATATLDAAGIAWVDVVSSDDEFATDAMSAADLGVSAQMECSEDSGRRVIRHGGQLPELPEFSIVLYADDRGGNHLNQMLVDYLARAYR